MRIAYTAIAEDQLKYLIRQAIEIWGKDFAKVKITALQRAISSLSDVESHTKFADSPESDARQYFIISENYVVFYEIYKTHIYIIDIQNIDELPFDMLT